MYPVVTILVHIVASIQSKLLCRRKVVIFFHPRALLMLVQYHMANRARTSFTSTQYCTHYVEHISAVLQYNLQTRSNAFYF